MDIAALRAAKAAGLPTGGTMPKGFRTLAGPHPDWAKEFGLRESADYRYPERTEANVFDSYATLRIARDFQTAGERCTLRFIEKWDRPYRDIAWPPATFWDGPILVASWIHEHAADVLNVAGNGREDMERGVEEYLTVVFKFCAENLA